MWKPSRNSQKCHLPSRSLSILPVIFGIPVVESAEKAEDDGPHQNVVEVGNDEIGVVQLPVPGRECESMIPVKPANRN